MENIKYETNLKKLLEYMKLEDNEEGRVEFERRLSKISEISRKAILISWGLTEDSNVTCPPYYNRLNKKLGLDENSSEIYQRATRELFELSFARMLVDEEKFELQKAIYLGFLASIVIGSNIEERTIIGENLMDVIETTLTYREAKVLKMRKGLEGPEYKIYTLERIAVEFNLTVERIRQIELKAIRKLRHASRTRLFYTVAKAEFEAKQAQAKSQKDEDASLSTLSDISVRAYNCLMRHGVDTIKKLLELTEDDLWKVKNLGKKCVEEIKEIQRKLKE